MKKLNFDGIELKKKEFYESKKAVDLKKIDVGKIVVSGKVKGNNYVAKVLIGLLNEGIVVPLCLVLPQMSGWIKYFEIGGKNMSFKVEEAWVYLKYNEIWNKTKGLLGIKFNSEPIYEDQYIKTKVKTFDNVVKTLFDGGIPKERVEYTCIPCISVDSVLKVDKKWYPQVYLEQGKYK